MANIRNGLLPLTGVIDGVRGPAGKDGKPGNPGVWVGTEPPESSEYEVWVNPDGDGPIISLEWDSIENKPFESLGEGLSVDSEGVLSSTGVGISDWSEVENKPFESIGSGLSVNEGVLSANIPEPEKELPDIETGDAGKVLTVNSTEDGVEWATGGSDITIDNATIVENQFGNIETAIGGKWVEGKIPGNTIVSIDNTTSTNVSTIVTYDIMQTLISKGSDLRANLNTGFGTENGCSVTIDTSVTDTYKLTCNYTITTVKCVYTGTGDSSNWSCIRSFEGGSSGYNSSGNSFYAMEDGYLPSPIIDGRFIPIDNQTIITDSNNNLITGYIGSGTGDKSILINTAVLTKKTRASGANCIVIGDGQTNGSNAIVIGTGDAMSNSAVSIGDATHASAQNGISIGSNNYVRGNYATAIGLMAQASSQYQTALGKGNKNDAYGVFCFIIGNNPNWGFDGSDALAIDWNGNHYIQGDIYVGCSDYSTNSSGLVTAGAGGTKLARIPNPPDVAGTYTLQCVADGNGGFTYSWV